MDGLIRGSTTGGPTTREDGTMDTLDAIGDEGSRSFGFENETSELPALIVAAGETLALNDDIAPRPRTGDSPVMTAGTVRGGAEIGAGGIGAITCCGAGTGSGRDGGAGSPSYEIKSLEVFFHYKDK